MKNKCLTVICLILVVINVVGCRKKSTSEQRESAQQTKVSNKAEMDQAVAGKSTAEKLLAQESVTAINVSEAQGDETEYFALFMEDKKVGYAIQSRDVEGRGVG